MAPVIERLAARDDVDTRIVVGGLRPGPSAQALDADMRAMLARHWAKVAATTGQPFDESGLDRADWTYDTELPAIAVTTMRAMAPEATLPFFNRLQEAFYRDAVDITDIDQYPQLVAGFAIDETSFLHEITTKVGRDRAWHDFSTAREMGVRGFPTVLLKLEGSTQILSRGYAPLDHFENQLSYWVEGRQPGSASAYTCSVDDSSC
jgi:putative protein-disulfide isomerase